MIDASPRRILVTSALPYANGPIHIGHLVEYIQTDIWVRMMRMAGHAVTYVCADDAHGTPIMLKAEAEGIAPEALIARVSNEHQRDFARFNIGFDHYHSTHSEENRSVSTRIFERLNAQGYITVREIEQAYDAEREMFLPDRFIRGTCPVCGAPDQYGDGCEQCSATYTPADLIDPVSAVSGSTPVTRTSEHLFFRLGAFADVLKRWMAESGLHPAARNKLQEWFEAGLKDWDISRDAPYFGFEIPGYPGKFFYVWLDAPIGYLGALMALCAERGEDFEALLAADSDLEIHHFIGKDILYFHALFWPAMLAGAGLRMPTALHVHGFLTVDGKKMSKSRGTFITAQTFAEHLEPELLRYYLAGKLGPDLDDIDLNLEDFRNRVNADLVGKYVNIASRACKFIETRFDGRLGEVVDQSVLAPLVTARAEVTEAFEALEYARAIRCIMGLADQINQFIDAEKPWVIAKEQGATAALLQICTTALNGFRILSIYLKPVLPNLAARAEALFNESDWVLEDAGSLRLGTTLRPFEPLLQRVDARAIDAMLEASQATLAAQQTSAAQQTGKSPGESTRPGAVGTGAQAGSDGSKVSGAVKSASPKADSGANNDKREAAPEAPEYLDINTFAEVDLRVGRVLEAGPVEGADKLIQLSVDIGEARPRNIFAGIKSAYDPATLTGRMVVVVANLKPRKMRFGVSEGMVLAAGPGGEAIFVVSPDAGAQPGMQVK